VVVSDQSRYIAGVLLLIIVVVEYGGWLLGKIVRGQAPMTNVRDWLVHSAHAHAGILATVALVCQVLADAVALGDVTEWVARIGVPAAAIFMSIFTSLLVSGGLFVASARRTSPSTTPSSGSGGALHRRWPGAFS
jgi:hypothetical protein